MPRESGTPSKRASAKIPKKGEMKAVLEGTQEKGQESSEGSCQENSFSSCRNADSCYSERNSDSYSYCEGTDFGRIFPEEARHRDTPCIEPAATISTWLSLSSSYVREATPERNARIGRRWCLDLTRVISKMEMPYRQANFPKGLFKEWNEAELRNFIRCIAQYSEGGCLRKDYGT